jgi:PKD repeat protein
MKVVIRAAVCTFAVVGLLAGLAAPAYGDVGYRGATTAGISASAPTGAKPESKLWWNDGYWWANMWDASTRSNHIFRLDTTTQRWLDTGVEVDARAGSRADALWDGTHLYIASHEFSNSSSAGKPSYLYRFSYDAAIDRYSLDAGFPVVINNYRLEALVIDKDSTGKLWATWVQDNAVYVNRTVGDDRTWGQPFALAVTGASNLTADDISSIVAFGDKVGVMWSNQNTATMHWSQHVDGAPDTMWQESAPALQGDPNNLADDHINLKAGSDGRVFAATKTSETSPAGPLTMLLVRDASTGAWTRHVFGRKQDRHTRPIVVLDETNQMVHVFATAAEAGGSIYQKSAPLNAISFPTGRGKLVVQDDLSADVNDPTSTKQSVTVASGLAVLASDDSTDLYWHSFDTLVLGADFTAGRTTGLAPLTVQFTDTSSGYPRTWSWDFGDGATSTLQNPSHTYTQSGTYTVTMTATDATGNTSTKSRTAYVTILESAGFLPTEDAYVNSLSPDKNFGTYWTVRVREGGVGKTTFRSYLKFNVSGLDRPVTAAKLRLYVDNPSPIGGTIHTAPSSWAELGLTWNTAPALDPAILANVGNATVDSWVDVELPASFFAAGNGTYTIALQSTSPDDAWYSSREGADPPQLIVGFASQ